MKMTKTAVPKNTLIMLLLCVASALCNIAAGYAAQHIPVPMYLDTMLTITMTFYGGLLPGVVTGALTNLITQTVWFHAWGDYLFTLCNIAVAIITSLFIRIFPDSLRLGGSVNKGLFGKEMPIQESRRYKTALDRVVALTLLSFALCIAISILGGIFSTCIKIFTASGGTGPEFFFIPFLRRGGLPLLAVEILSRIPVNIIDRLVSSFCGYGLALLLCAGSKAKIT
jgi:hypothetical protein